MKVLFFWALVAAGLSVTLGALASHGLKKILSSDGLEIFNKGTYYLMIHALSVILLLLFKNTSKLRISEIGILTLFAGAAIFSCALFLVAFSEFPSWGFLKGAGAIAPIGGALMIGSWFYLAFQIYKQKTT